jgi:Domain of unknown function (DUF4396)
MKPYPEWLHVLALIYLLVCFVCAAVILVDFLRGYRQKMAIMYFVWPITALYFGPVAMWLYLRTRVFSIERNQKQIQNARKSSPNQEEQPPKPEQVSTAVFHCGAGCTLGDVISETMLFAVGGVTFIAGSEFLSRIVIDFALAFLIGIVFQYFTIVPMRNLSPMDGIAAAAKADTASILSFEIGMFAWMAITYYFLFPNPHVHPNQAVFWFMMQLAMIIGWATAYPANKWLIVRGWKEKMPQMPDQVNWSERVRDEQAV